MRRELGSGPWLAVWRAGETGEIEERFTAAAAGAPLCILGEVAQAIIGGGLLNQLGSLWSFWHQSMPASDCCALSSRAHRVHA